VLDDADRSALPDRLDPTGDFRRELRSALIAAVLPPEQATWAGCDRELVRTARCASHTGRGPSPDSPAA
jgi:hypothetical protein